MEVLICGSVAVMSDRVVYRLVSRRFVGGFIVGAAVSSASCLAALHLYHRKRAEPEPVKKSVLEEYGYPQSGNEVRQYVGHSLSYDQERKTPRWVIEHLTKEKTVVLRVSSHIAAETFIF
ncbi:hypothetical protein AB205_0170010 [Aquarana catesbeiana]|uniref:DNA/RNA non-specific endonuclease/pyrophosphatase/phosphodiesterase domain-containing protein n=1 Tax=Aquarana catesbeiana TaxID=8400 RepID=A0A2G9R9Z9_AQUCT|nr:hypothetical protein AB205_0170010 [Aquarana catesbeiana]